MAIRVHEKQKEKLQDLKFKVMDEDISKVMYKYTLEQLLLYN